MPDKGRSSGEASAQLPQDSFDAVFNNVEIQAEANQPIAQNVTEQQQEQQEVSQEEVTQQTVNAYWDFINSVCSWRWKYRSKILTPTRASESQRVQISLLNHTKYSIFLNFSIM